MQKHMARCHDPICAQRIDLGKTYYRLGDLVFCTQACCLSWQQDNARLVMVAHPFHVPTRTKRWWEII